VILTDAGPLVAVIDRQERNHARCLDALETLAGPMVTTWPAFTEAMHLLGAAAGWQGQQALWEIVGSGNLQLAATSPKGLVRMKALMEKYRDLPMDLADASLVALAEERNLRRIFTLDRDFAVYRLPGRKTFVTVP